MHILTGNAYPGMHIVYRVIMGVFGELMSVLCHFDFCDAGESEMAKVTECSQIHAKLSLNYPKHSF